MYLPFRFAARSIGIEKTSKKTNAGISPCKIVCNKKLVYNYSCGAFTSAFFSSPTVGFSSRSASTKRAMTTKRARASPPT